MVIHRIRSLRSFAAVACLVALSPSFAWAGIEPTPFRTGLFSVARGQGVRISIVNAGAARGIITPCVRVWDSQARLLAETDVGRLHGGRSASAVFVPTPNDGTPGGVPIPEDGRVMVRVEVELQPVPNDGTPPPEDGEPVPNDGQPVPDDNRAARAKLRRLLADVIPTVEVFDLKTGRTQYTLPFARVVFNPQPEAAEPVRSPQ